MDLFSRIPGPVTDTRELEIVDPRDVFMRDLDLPREQTRELVFIRDHDYCELRGSESRMLSTVGAFRVVPASDLRDAFDRPADPHSTDLRHLREEGLVRTVPIAGRRTAVVTLTNRGRDVLEHHRSERHHDHRQTFHAGLRKQRELVHDSQVCGLDRTSSSGDFGSYVIAVLLAETAGAFVVSNAQNLINVPAACMPKLW
jgi:hypothetical protein